jgi:hypothetical protein
MSIMEETKQQIGENYGRLPLAFIPNVGQMNEDIYYGAQGAGWEIACTAKEVVFTFMKRMSDVREISSSEEITTSASTVQRIALAFCFLGANPEVKIEGQDEGIGKVNYFVGNDPTKWMTDLPIYHEVVYRELWPGVDLFFRGKNGQSKYTFVVQPGALVQNIQFTYDGAEALSLDEKGNLQIHTPYGILIDERPISYQEIDGERVPVSSSFVVQEDEKGGKRYEFEVGRNYDPRFPLLIDLGLIYSTYFGGSSNDGDTSIAVDTAGNAYVTGFASSSNFSTTVGAFQTSLAGSANAFVTKVSSITASSPLIICSPNITVPNQLGQCGAMVPYLSPTVFDTCPGGFTVSCNPSSGSFFPLGTTSVTCTVTDACGEFASCPFTVTVVDTEPPTIVCPDDMTVGINPSQSGTIVNYPNPTVSDNCPEGLTWLCTPSSGSFFPLGTTTVTCIAADAAGNTSECSFTITVFTTLATECIRVCKVYDWVIVPSQVRVRVPLP